MAQFCTKCGTPLGEGMSFCTNCGVTVGAPPAPLAPPPIAAAPAAVGAAPAGVAPVAKSGGPLLKIVLIVLAVFVLIGLLGVGSCVFFAYRTRQRLNQFKRQAQITFPSATGTGGGPTESETQTSGTGEVKTGVPVYPGATPTEAGGDMSMGVGIVAVQEYTTDDSVDKVIEFYKDKLGSSVSVQQAEGKALLQVIGSSGLTNITVFHDDSSGKTKFSITRIGK